MEALWSIEDRFKVSTQKAVALFACTGFLVICLCTAAAMKRCRRKGAVYQEPYTEASTTTTTWAEPPRPGWGSVKKALMSSVRWSGVSKWDVQFSGSERERPTPLLARGSCAGDSGWQSHNSTSPVWQRPILMGEKCELPRFSGLILYDERGRPLDQCEEGNIYKQEEKAADVRTTLRDLL
ncbi:unnamed protein product [Fraxinus pennsylvanica]|uniref:Transmembrane protein n=1 Tax=Fraxinus pennsylvanica TaxID=56036 RepID=A0AAD2AGQ8_9LAMI|nr:unnamed protein product [Fraxinus pennsylvanica]